MPFRILSLSGGGFLGLYTISVLGALEEELGRPIATCFDLIAGTSVGGILALGLAADVSAAKIVNEFETNGQAIFSARAKPRPGLQSWLDLRRSLFSSKYDGHALRGSIERIVGCDTKMGDLKHPVIVPAVNLTKGEPQVFKTPHHANFVRDRNVLVADVAMATAAAPSFFPIAQVGDELFADGGMYANSPDGLALHEAEYYFRIGVDDVRMLSIGTTTAKFSFPHGRALRAGILAWAKDQDIFEVMIGAQQINTIAMLKQRLGDNYLRIDAFRGRAQEEILALDVATLSAQRTLRALAEASVRSNIVAPLVRQLLGK